MGTPATDAKNKYNKKAYKKILVTIKPDLFNRFDTYCKENNLSKNGLITNFIEELLNK